VAPDADDEPGGGAVRPDRAVRRVRRGRHRRLGRATPAPGPRGRPGPGRGGLRGLRARRGVRTALRHVAPGTAGPYPGADAGWPDRMRRHAPRLAGPGRVAGPSRVRGHRARSSQRVPCRHRSVRPAGRIGGSRPDLDARL
jgi:hypothetical protein